MHVRLATEADRPLVIETVVAAFAQDPAFRYFFPGDDRYREQATAFVGYLFDKRIEHRTIWVTEDCSATSLWSPPDHMLTENSRARAVALAASMQQQVGADAATRLGTYDAAVDRGLPPQPFWYLGILAAHPTRAGGGFGRAVMDAGLEHVRTAGGVAILETTNPGNPAYYQRWGWEVIDTVESETPSTVWILQASSRLEHIDEGPRP